MLLGALFSSAFEIFVPQAWIDRLKPQKTYKGVLMGVSMGLILPTCECGVVPIVKKLLQKGFPGYMVFSYLLSAPVVNPIVMISTYIAFRYSYWMLMGRLGIVIAVAVVVGILFSRYRDGFLLDKPDEHTHHADSHGSHGSCCTQTCCHSDDQKESKMFLLFNHTSKEFIDMCMYLIIGAFCAGAFKTFVPREIISLYESNLVLSILMMMILAVVLSVCSEADSFVAASFTSFSSASHLAFVTLGPMVDIKLIIMYLAVFKRKIFNRLMIIPAIMVFVITYLIGVFLK